MDHVHISRLEDGWHASFFPIDGPRRTTLRPTFGSLLCDLAGVKVKKKCKICQRRQSLDEYHRDVSSDDGISDKCKSCAKRFRRKKA
jgi:hypothetical protein